MRLWRVLRRGRFGFLWSGMTVSALGDEMSSVTIVWLTYERSHSPAMLSAVVIAYTAPLWLGGFLAGYILDRFPRRTALMCDNAIRGAVFGAIAVAGLSGHFALCLLFAAATLCGFLRMISLAGIPAMIPSLVAEEDVSSANALESLAFQSASVLGPALGGLLLITIGGLWAIALDAVTYFVFVACLTAIPEVREQRAMAARSKGLRGALHLIVTVPALLTITLMFMCFNTTEGAVSVLLPVYVTIVLHAGAPLYGALLSIHAAGAILSTLAVGIIAAPRLLGRSIAVLQVAAGVTLGALTLAGSPLLVCLVYGVVGVFTGPLTVWAQTLRMGLIPAEMRGGVFALLRTFMQSTPPLGAAVAGAALGHVSIVSLIAMMSAIIAVPAMAALVLPVFRPADRLVNA